MKRSEKGKRSRWVIIAWIAVSIALMFANVDFGLLLLLIGGVILLFVFAIKKDRQISKRRKEKKNAEHKEETVQTSYSAPVRPISRAPSMSVEYVGPDGFERVTVKVAGVTFANGRRQRQTILREIHWKDKEYSGPVNVTLRQMEYEGKIGIEVWANNEQIGFVPSAQADYFIANWNRFDGCEKLKVYGGGTKPSGEPINFGASFVARFRD